MIIFAFKQTGIDKNRVAEGYFFGTQASAPSLPRTRLEVRRLWGTLPTDLFERRILNI